MRRIFDRIENLQHEALQRAGISRFDERLRRVRQMSRNLFERAWPLAQRKGLTSTERDAATLYIHCLMRILNWEKMAVSDAIFKADKKITQFITENFR